MISHCNDIIILETFLCILKFKMIDTGMLYALTSISNTNSICTYFIREDINHKWKKKKNYF